jgi:hypothetical protein
MCEISNKNKLNLFTFYFLQTSHIIIIFLRYEVNMGKTLEKLLLRDFPLLRKTFLNFMTNFSILFAKKKKL